MLLCFLFGWIFGRIGGLERCCREGVGVGNDMVEFQVVCRVKLGAPTGIVLLLERGRSYSGVFVVGGK